MPIVDRKGRPHSQRTIDERVDLVKTNYSKMSLEEQEAYREIMGTLDTRRESFETLVDVEYARPPVPFRTFITHPYFLGGTGNSLWPQLIEDMAELFDGGYHEAVLGGCLGLDSLVMGANGSLLPLGERIGRSERVLTLCDGGCAMSVSGPAVESGVQKVIRVSLANGASLDLTPDHLLSVWRHHRREWVAAGQVADGDLVAVPRRVRVESDSDLTVTEARLLAYWVADGSDVVVPDAVCRASDSVVAEFLNRLWACEGTVYATESGKSPPRFNLAMISETFVRQIQLLLLRFGVRGRVCEVLHKDKRRGGRVSRCWHLTVSGVEQLGRFLGAVGDILGKEGACERIAAYCRKTKPNTNVDLLPVTWGWLNDYMNACGFARPRGSRWQMLATSKECRVSRSLFNEWLTHFGGTDAGRQARAMFHPDIGYEPVVSVEAILTEVPTGDVTDVDLGSCYLANGILAHNSLGWGKSFFATTALAYVLYQISCLRSPQKAYGLDVGSYLVVAMLSVTEKTARRVAVNELLGKISHSRYFRENFPFDAAPSNLEIRFPNQVMVVGGSTGSSAVIGLNAFSGFIDESSFMGDSKEVDRAGNPIEVDKGEQIYKSIIRRMKSRFMRAGALPGVLILASSKERPVAFVERRIQDAREQNDKNIFVREYATWDVKPPEFFSDGVFLVAAGTDKTPSRILGQDPEEELVAQYKDKGMTIVEVPMDYWDDFERDLEGSLRDIAGIATDSVSPFMPRTDSIYDAIDDTLVKATDADEWVADRDLEINWGLVSRPFKRKLPGGYTEQAWRPIRHPNAIRHVHIDPSLTGDCTGIAIAHIAGWKQVQRRSLSGDKFDELAPIIETDLLLRVVPPPGDEILLSDVRSIIYQFRDHGFQISYASTDSFQNADTLQQFRKQGMEAELLSVDRTADPYDTLKTCLYERRLRMHGVEILNVELRNLQRIPKKSSGGRHRVVIDHPKQMSMPDGRRVKGSKDLADGLAGVVYSLTQRTPGHPMAPMMGVSEGSVVQEQVNHDWVTEGRTLIKQEGGKKGQEHSIVGPSPGSSVDDLPMPFSKG